MNIERYKEDICRMWLHGMSCKEISFLVPFSQAKISAYCRKLRDTGQIDPSQRIKKQNAKRTLVQEAFMQGEHDLDKLAERFGLQRQSVMTYLVGLNRGKEMRTDKSKEIALALAKSEYKLGLLADIAKQHGVTRSYVTYILKRIENYL